MPQTKSQAMSQTNLPDVGKMNSALADHHARLQRYMLSLPERIDDLVEATNREDWSELRRVAGFLASSAVIYDCPAMAGPAQQLRDSLDGPHDAVKIKRNVIRLISRCGSMRVTTATAVG